MDMQNIMGGLSAVMVNVLGLVAAAVLAATPFLVKMVIGYLEKRFKFDVAEADERKLEKAVADGVLFAEEWARGKLKAAGGEAAGKPSSEEKELKAVAYVTEAINKLGLEAKGSEWVAGKVKAYLAGLRNAGTLLLPILLLLSVGMASCGMRNLQKIDTVGGQINNLWNKSTPTWGAMCKAEALKCRKEGVVVPLSECPRAEKCLKGLEIFEAALSTCDGLLATALPLAVADDPKAADYLAAAMTAFSKAVDAWQNWEAVLKQAPAAELGGVQ